jgi:hypothetical protein
MQTTLKEFPREADHIYIVWSMVRDEARDPRGSYTLIARCVTCGRIVGTTDYGKPTAVYFYPMQICKFQTTQNGIKEIIKLAKQEFGQNKLNATKEETH